MKKVALLIVVFVFPFVTISQEKKFEYTPKVKNRVEITNLLGEISIQNASGSAIIIESDFNMEKPERAEGLVLLGALDDNTELGVNVSEENGIVSISGATKQVRDYKYTISIPVGIAVNIDYSSPFASGDVEIDSYKGSLELKTLSANVKLSECTGPFTINTISGDVEVSFSNINQDEPSSLASVSGLIDISVSANQKATFEISNLTGNVYNNLNLENISIEKDDGRASGLKSIKHSDGDSFSLNGGGQNVYLKSISGNIYLRKQ